MAVAGGVELGISRREGVAGTLQNAAAKCSRFFGMDDGEMSRAPTAACRPYSRISRVFEAALKRKVTPYEWGKEVAPGLLAVETIGHTPGHISDASHSPGMTGLS